ncbi:MAG: transposase [Bacteroidetes bacterium]|nr:transposase [Bacteroidota bacterium]
MPYRNTSFTPHHCYHIYNRGNHRETVFIEEYNYIHFLRRLRKYLPPDKITILAYCLMPNHYHLLIEIREECDVSNMMKNLIISYTKAINLRYNVVGHLFQGRFHSKEVDSERYLLTLIRYIHNNPVAAQLVSKREEWKYSSYAEYLGIRENSISSPGRVISLFSSIEEFTVFSEGLPMKEHRAMSSALFPRSTW